MSQTPTLSISTPQGRMSMECIELHIGMPKAGSTTIQSWLSLSETRRLLAGLGISVCAARTDHAGSTMIEPYESGRINSGGVIPRYYQADPEVARGIIDGFFTALEKAVVRLGHIILSSEAFTQPFWKDDGYFLEHLQRLAEAHRVRVAYYVRPQHSALEAAWRQWGFRTGQRPAAYVRRRSAQLHYLETVLRAKAAVPDVELLVRPFREDLLEGGDIISDYVRVVLGLAVSPSDIHAGGLWENRGLPLEVVNLLSGVPRGLLWSGPHDNEAIDAIREMLGEVDIPTSERIEESRRVLLGYSHGVFESANLDLVAMQGWATDHFVPSPRPQVPVNIGRLNRLWAPSASEAEQAFMHLALRRALGQLQ